MFHLPKSQGSYVYARTGRVTSNGSKAKEKMYPLNSNGDEDAESTQGKLKKVCKCPLRCIICCATSAPKTKISKLGRLPYIALLPCEFVYEEDW